MLSQTYASSTFEDQGASNVATAGAVTVAPVELSVVGNDRDLSKKVGTALEKSLRTQFQDISLSEKYPQRVQVYELRFEEQQLLFYDISEFEIFY